MDVPGTLEDPPEPVQPAGEPLPLLLAIGLWVPVFAVVIWFMVRLFTGRWIHEPVSVDEAPRAPEEHEPVGERIERPEAPSPPRGPDPLDRGDDAG